MTAQLMAAMSDEHLVAAIRAEHDPLTSTAIEDELLARFERAISSEVTFEDYDVTKEQIETILEAHPADADVLAMLLAALNDAGIHGVESLAELIKRADTALV